MNIGVFSTYDFSYRADYSGFATGPAVTLLDLLRQRHTLHVVAGSSWYQKLGTLSPARPGKYTILIVFTLGNIDQVEYEDLLLFAEHNDLEDLVVISSDSYCTAQPPFYECTRGEDHRCLIHTSYIGEAVDRHPVYDYFETEEYEDDEEDC